MKKHIARFMFICFAAALPQICAYASDAPTEEGEYYWQDENNDFWKREGSTDIYIGSADDYSLDPDTGMLMENQDAGWTSEDDSQSYDYSSDDSYTNSDDTADEAYGYYWQDENGDIYFFTGEEDNYVGAGDMYYIGADGYLYTYEGSENSEDSEDAQTDVVNASEEDTAFSVDSQNTGDHVYLSANLPLDAVVEDSYDTVDGGYSEKLNYDNGKTIIEIRKEKIDYANSITDPLEYLKLWYDLSNYDDWEAQVESYPATRIIFDTVLEETDDHVGNALIFCTDTYIYSLITLTDADLYNNDEQELIDFWMNSAALFESDPGTTEYQAAYENAESTVDTDYFNLTLPDTWQGCRITREYTDDAGYALTFFGDDAEVMTIRTMCNNGTPRELESVWQGYLGQITTPDGDIFDLVYTISQYAPDETQTWQAMYDTYQDVLQSIVVDDGYTLTEGSYKEYSA